MDIDACHGQPRNKEIVASIRKSVEDNKNILIFPKEFEHNVINKH